MKLYLGLAVALLSAYVNAEINFEYSALDEVPDKFKEGQPFGEYHYVKDSFGLKNKQGTIFYYLTAVRPEISKWYRRELKISKLNKRKGRDYIPYLPLSEEKIIYANGSSESVLYEGENIHLSQGPAQDDYWGCLHERPLFKIYWPLLNQNSDAQNSSNNAGQDSEYAVLITGDGNGSSTGGHGASASDSLYVNVIDHTGKIAIKAPMLNVSYDSYPLIDYELEDYLFFTDAGIPDGSDREDLIAKDSKDPTAGRKGYGKLFAQDFNDNGQQDLVFWHRIYKSHKAVKDPKTKEWDTSKRYFEFEREWFTWYEENNERNGFIKRELTTEQGKQWLSDNQLGWNDGYPKDNSQCESEGVRKIPMMTGVYDPELKPYQK
jgi:hypothetical protein